MNRVRTGARNLAWAVGLLVAGASGAYAAFPLTTVPLTINSQDSGAKISVVTPATKNSPATTTPATSPMTLQAGQTIDVEGGSAALTIGTTKVVLSAGTQLQINSGSQVSGKNETKTNPSFTVNKGQADVVSKSMVNSWTGSVPLYAGSTVSTDKKEADEAVLEAYLSTDSVYGNGTGHDTITGAQLAAWVTSRSEVASFYANLGLTQTFEFNPPAQMGGQNSVPVSPSAP